MAQSCACESCWGHTCRNSYFGSGDDPIALLGGKSDPAQIAIDRAVRNSRRAPLQPRESQKEETGGGDSAAVVTSDSWVRPQACAELNGGLDLAMVAETG